jgi:hypothetical protein
MSDPVKKLYRVEVSFVMFVLAEDDYRARDLARQYANDESPDEAFATQVLDPSHIDPEWRNALPYGGTDDKTCVQILTPEPGSEPPYEDPNQQKLFC